MHSITKRRPQSVAPASAAGRILTFSLLVVSALLLARGRAGAQSVSPTLRDLVGVNNPIAQSFAQQLAVGWIRVSASWAVIEPTQGKMDWSFSDKLVRQTEDAGAQPLLLLAYTPRWDQTIESAGQAPPKNPADWTHFVQEAVSRYGAAPYNVKYFQIWNEPTRQAHFWLGTDNEYVDMIYLPAAKIIRQHGDYVVFGGWPLSNSVQELDNVLNYHNAWQWTDIVDTHYHRLADVQHEYAQWVATGKCRGVWQSEMGYDSNPEAALSQYTNLIRWSLQVGWKDRDEFKFFWYPGMAAGPDAARALIRAGANTLTDNGKHLATINQIMGQGPLASFSQFSTQPPRGPGRFDSAGFRVGSDRTVIELIIPRTTAASLRSVAVRVSAPGSRAQLVSGLGKTWDLRAQSSGGGVQVNVPISRDLDDCPACHYIWGFIVLDR